ncbi:RdgB/HAM1 family non-canonical purine NTP pyrophosphatase [Saccharospirillum salsuginis]|uniref:dITP/XTP pyrophosphatase n=1 Tax=Saccharospirillum salsuginis TaxID=418750 RepID=A0A918N5Q1_9GAMM|nr:RdgB/HAM1 family non-canonical purine NTP pyrophosphatase [Saccharospirillum salsuginis]GGX42939.1 non-canonical purine NTP pyrophosphatase [Saccharospirillum salsuginis]
MSQWVLASGNAGKLREFGRLLEPLDIEVVPQKELGVVDADETGLSFIENAILKARHAAEATGLPALADDSGLEIDALNGAPGIYSARYSALIGGEHNDTANIERVLNELKDVPEAERTARFQCVLAFMRHAQDPTPLIVQRSWEGVILTQPVGEDGFGYDPIFYVPDQGCTAAELAPEVKNRLSHRGQAMAAFLPLLEQRLTS